MPSGCSVSEMRLSRWRAGRAVHDRRRFVLGNEQWLFVPWRRACDRGIGTPALDGNRCSCNDVRLVALRSGAWLHFPARLSTSASSHHDLSLAAFITNIAEFDFRYTQLPLMADIVAKVPAKQVKSQNAQ